MAVSSQQPCKLLGPRSGFRQPFFSRSLQPGRKRCQTLEWDIAASAELRFFAPTCCRNFAPFLLGHWTG